MAYFKYKVPTYRLIQGTENKYEEKATPLVNESTRGVFEESIIVFEKMIVLAIIATTLVRENCIWPV